MFRITTIPVLSDNYAYLIECSQTGQAAIVDPGEAGPVIAEVVRSRVTPVAIWNTHHHADHVGGNVDILARWPGLCVYGHSSDRDRIPNLSVPIEHGTSVVLGKLVAHVIHTPGHTLGGICYVLDGAVFTGDTLFAAGCGRLFEGDAAMMYRSLNEVLLPALKSDTQIYCGHEYTQKNLEFSQHVDPENPEIRARLTHVRQLRAAGKSTIPTNVAIEQQTNPFLRCATAAQPVARFSELRELRNRF